MPLLPSCNDSCLVSVDILVPVTVVAAVSSFDGAEVVKTRFECRPRKNASRYAEVTMLAIKLDSHSDDRPLSKYEDFPQITVLNMGQQDGRRNPAKQGNQAYTYYNGPKSQRGLGAFHPFGMPHTMPHPSLAILIFRYPDDVLGHSALVGLKDTAATE
ncbi:hypothetical protein An04g02290 [Aspergillus niger]|uniref:Uncharacterized protein n=2 Tax=Aspergillus niger TaxID=5061 RepID=A2QI51_ASPNC|nr:hypothetical protein An04g02290 [Aspergillus niger]CAL00716.1 hypothetical protein An04g02290 [Aspergillus niger]